MARQLRSGTILKAPKINKKIQKKPSPVKKQAPKKQAQTAPSRPSTRSQTPQKQVKAVKKVSNIKKTRSIEEVQQLGISFLKRSDRSTRSGYTLSNLQKQSKLVTRSKDPKLTPFTMKTRSKDPKKAVVASISSGRKTRAKKPEPVSESEEESEAMEEKEEEEEVVVETKKKKTRKSIPSFSVPSIGMIDVVFCCDTTGSMQSYIDEVKKAIKQISQNIISKVGLEGIDVKFGFVGYQDHKPQMQKYVTKVHDLDTDVNMIKLIDGEQCYGGGDMPEAVLDGLWDACEKISWREHKNTPYLRYVYHICDAPPHGDIYSSSSSFKKGCPCKLTAEKIGKAFAENQIHYRLIKTTDYYLEKMTEIFKKNFYSFDTYTLKEAPELNVRVSDMFNNEVFPIMKK